MSKTNAEARYLCEMAKVPCVICTRFTSTGLPTELHHVAVGSSKRSHFAAVPLCGDRTDGGHHRGAAGFHGMGERAFCRLYRPPFENEYGLLVWAAEDLFKHWRMR